MQICQYRSLADSVQKLVGSDGTILKAYTFLRDMQFESNPCEILSYIDYWISNPDFKIIANCLNPMEHEV